MGYFLAGITSCFLGRDDNKAATAVAKADEENAVVAPVEKEEDEPAPADDEPAVDEEQMEPDKVEEGMAA